MINQRYHACYNNQYTRGRTERWCPAPTMGERKQTAELQKAAGEITVYSDDNNCPADQGGCEPAMLG